MDHQESIVDNINERENLTLGEFPMCRQKYTTTNQWSQRRQERLVRRRGGEKVAPARRELSSEDAGDEPFEERYVCAVALCFQPNYSA
jgi:hypothetical protein